MASHKAGFGVNIAPIADINDPFDTCDPIGFPRIILFNLRGVQIVQTPKQVLMLYQNTRTFRTIWTDGRESCRRTSPSRDGSAIQSASGRTRRRWSLPPPD